VGPMVMEVLGEMVKVLCLMHHDLHDIKVVQSRIAGVVKGMMSWRRGM
jgi:hypothetical protein